ncbi:MAG: NAD(P)H-dependent oxidoreductase [Pseudomonadota bacterium]|nr:NAD(P)H-dependent oxidoreductase [Pseudomonadota bacterium]
MNAPSAIKPVNLLGISGSLRRGANSTAVLRTLQDEVGSEVRLEVESLRGIPLYDQDEEDQGEPERVRTFKAAIARADGLVVVSPEYNYGVPGVLKNAIDWASRPAFNSVLKDKPALIITSSPSGVGGARAAAQIREALGACLARLVPHPQLAIGAVHQKIRDGRLADEATLKRALAAISALLDEISAARALAGLASSFRGEALGHPR